ncbi:fibronectin type III domain-containing protein [Luteolibacter soli]|uniref:Fibronectin type III domain-containing protein n=1 Tax=Luteolibacter soli TaxID=3135280 RepID=A0ABU9B1U2_9BACT
MKSKLIPLLALAATVSVAPASVLIQELFDNISTGNATLNGAGSTATSIGLTGAWATNGSTGIYTANNFNVDGATLPGLPSNGGGLGGIWNNVGNWGTSVYATRPLATPINFAADRTIYFSVRLNNPGDTSMGVGLASGSAITSDFVGAGFTWNNAIPIGSSSNIAGNSPFISYGKLDGAQQSGVYGIRAYEAGHPVNAHGLLVGRIKIKATGNDEIDIKRYAPNQTIDNNLTAILWSAHSEVDSAMSATHLLLWMNGQGSGELDAIRFGDTWTDVTGVTLAGTEQPAMSGAAVASITGTGAQASANLFTSAADVYLYWDTVDKGTNAGAWNFVNPLGAKAIGPVSGAITGLLPDTLYYYRFRGVNTVADPDLEGWSEENHSFATAPTGLAITDLEAIPFTTYEVDLFWSDTFATETGFQIQRSPAGANNWVTVATAPPDTTFYTNRHTGLVPNTAYDYRVLAVNAAGTSNPSNVSTITTLPGTPLETKLLINFDGTVDGTTYTLGGGEVDATGTFKANGVPNVSNGVATLNPGNESGPDGFDINPTSLGSLLTQNWVAEALVTYHSTGTTTTTPVILDVQGDCNVRLRDQLDANVLQMFYWNGSSVQQRYATLPPSGVKVHIAYAWDAGSATLTGYVNGVAFGSATAGPFATPDPTTLSFGYFGRTGFEGRGIDGILDAVAFQTGTATVNPATDFLILPDTQNYAGWIAGFGVGGNTGFEVDADGDGLNNGLEAFMGTNPSVSTPGALIPVSKNGTVFTFSHPQASPALADVTGSYEWSQDFVTWYAGDGVAGPGGGVTVSIPTVTPVNGIATVTATASQVMTRVFVRLKAGQILAQ